MNVVQEIRRINENEQRIGSIASWHDEYKDSAYIFVGGLPYDLTEGDVICVFSQYGEIVNINLVRDKDTGASKGFVFLQYEDQRSTVLAVDNLNGVKLLGRTLRVDHVKNYRQPKQAEDDDGTLASAERMMNAAPQPIEHPDESADADGDGSESELMKAAGIDPEDPMATYYLEKYKRRMHKKVKRERKQHDKSGGDSGRQHRNRERHSKGDSRGKHRRDRSHSPDPTNKGKRSPLQSTDGK